MGGFNIEQSGDMMSNDAIGYVYRHSPYTGAVFAIHLAIADTVSDQHGNRFWMATDNLAKKVRCSRRTVQNGIDTLVEDRFIILTEYANQHSPAVYQFLFPDTDVVYESRSGVQSATSGVQSATARGAMVAPKPDRTQVQPKGNKRSTFVDPVFDTFWQNYPRKVGRKKCSQWWQRHGNQQILDSLDTWRQYWVQEGTDMRYIPHPYTWLNQERWRDPAPEPAVNQRTDTVLAVLNDIMGDQLDVAQRIMKSDTRPALEASNDPF